EIDGSAVVGAVLADHVDGQVVAVLRSDRRARVRLGPCREAPSARRGAVQAEGSGRGSDGRDEVGEQAEAREKARQYHEPDRDGARRPRPAAINRGSRPNFASPLLRTVLPGAVSLPRSLPPLAHQEG